MKVYIRVLKVAYDKTELLRFAGDCDITDLDQSGIIQPLNLYLHLASHHSVFAVPPKSNV